MSDAYRSRAGGGTEMRLPICIFSQAKQCKIRLDADRREQWRRLFAPPPQALVQLGQGAGAPIHAARRRGAAPLMFGDISHIGR